VAPTWSKHDDDEKKALIEKMKQLRNEQGEMVGAHLAIDGQFDSPGHCASYCAIGFYCLRLRE